MSQKFDELKQKIQNIDKDKAQSVLREVKEARDNGNIDEKEKQSLVDLAKEKIGGFDLGQFGL